MAYSAPNGYRYEFWTSKGLFLVIATRQAKAEKDFRAAYPRVVVTAIIFDRDLPEGQAWLEQEDVRRYPDSVSKEDDPAYFLGMQS